MFPTQEGRDCPGIARKLKVHDSQNGLCDGSASSGARYACAGVKEIGVE
jgi:hypothetical protein